MTSFRGFTLVELVVIIMIIGILAVFASGRFANEESFNARGYYDELVVAARYAQRYAVASGCETQFAIGANGSYAITLASACGSSSAGTAVQKPDGTDFLRPAPPAGVTIAPLSVNRTFNALGDNTGGNITITVSGAGSNHVFNITAQSGFVSTQ